MSAFKNLMLLTAKSLVRRHQGLHVVGLGIPLVVGLIIRKFRGHEFIMLGRDPGNAGGWNFHSNVHSIIVYVHLNSTLCHT